jgi:hypothetical protein
MNPEGVISVEKTQTRSQMIELDDGRKLNLSYYLLTQCEAGCDSYGIAIELRSSNGVETAAVEHITPIGKDALTLIDRLADGTVTPVCLMDVLPELLD